MDDALLDDLEAKIKAAQAGVAEMVVVMTGLCTALNSLIAAIGADDNAGGLLSRETIRKADEARLLLSRLTAPPADG